MSGRPVYRRSVPVLVITAIITTVLLLFGPAGAAQAEISWKSGVEMGDRPDGDGALVALGELSKNGSGRHIVVQFSEPVTLEQKAALETMGVGLLNYLGSNAFFATLKTGGLETVDLRAALEAQLIACGLSDSLIDVSNECTARDTHKYFSYRAEKGQTGRMMGFIGMRD